MSHAEAEMAILNLLASSFTSYNNRAVLKLMVQLYIEDLLFFLNHENSANKLRNKIFLFQIGYLFIFRSKRTLALDKYRAHLVSLIYDYVL